MRSNDERVDGPATRSAGDGGGDASGGPVVESSVPANVRARRLLGLAIERRETFGEYILVGWLGAGATANVYRARRVRDDRVVALKIMRDASAATPAELRRFRAGAAVAATLDHPRIVRVLDYGERGDEPFVAMDLIDGDNLQDHIDRGLMSPEQATSLMLGVAEAVAYAHERGIVHRDLKPANILVDRTGKPYVADFGLAKRIAPDPALGSAGASLAPGAVVGAPAYMAPELIDGGSGLGPIGRSNDTAGTTAFPCAADVYSLGAIFYQLLTGRLPCPGRSARELFERVRDFEPVPPRELNPMVGSDHQNVCMKCLAKAPSDRYPSAGGLAADLRNAIDRIPTVAHGPTVRARAARAFRRHPRVAAATAVVAFTALTTLGALGVLWRADANERARALATNGFIASGQAGALLFQLRAYGDRVERAACHPTVRALLERGVVTDPAPQLTPLAIGFDGVYLESMEGQVLAQWPSPVHHFVFERRYAFRDYFRGARRLGLARASGVYVAPAFRSESHDTVEFAISSPVLDDGGRQIGILAAALHAKEAFGPIRMQAGRAGGEGAATSESITTALIGPRGRERRDDPGAPVPDRYTFVVHPGLARGREVTLTSPSASRLIESFGPPAPPGEQLTLEYVQPLEVADHRDPTPGFEGRWLAAFAPVGRTGFVVVVETRRPDSITWSAALTPTIALPVLAGLALAATLLGWSWLSAARRRRPG